MCWCDIVGGVVVMVVVVCLSFSRLRASSLRLRFLPRVFCPDRPFFGAGAIAQYTFQCIQTTDQTRNGCAKCHQTTHQHPTTSITSCTPTCTYSLNRTLHIVPFSHHSLTLSHPKPATTSMTPPPTHPLTPFPKHSHNHANQPLTLTAGSHEYAGAWGRG